jgi:hypothetical protein
MLLQAIGRFLVNRYEDASSVAGVGVKLQQENIWPIKVSGGSAGTADAGSTYAKTELRLLTIRPENLRFDRHHSIALRSSQPCQHKQLPQQHQVCHRCRSNPNAHPQLTSDKAQCDLTTSPQT